MSIGGNHTHKNKLLKYLKINKMLKSIEKKKANSKQEKKNTPKREMKNQKRKTTNEEKIPEIKRD